MKKIILSILISTFMASCGGSGSGSSSSTSSLSDISGVWDSTTQEGAVSDVSFTIFKTDGTFDDYDYLGDAADAGPDCYEKYTGSISDLGGGNFLVNGTSEMQFSISGNTLQIINASGTYTMTRSNKQEAEFNLCGSSTPPPTNGLSSIEGIWDVSETINGLTDEYYTVFRDGQFIDYDYMGDSFDNGPNCYEVSSGALSYSGGNTFLLDNMISLDIWVTGDTLTLSLSGTSATYPRATLLESDFSPICNI